MEKNNMVSAGAEGAAASTKLPLTKNAWWNPEPNPATPFIDVTLATAPTDESIV